MDSSHREPESWEVAQVHSLGRNWKNLDLGNWDNRAELAAMEDSVTASEGPLI